MRVLPASITIIVKGYRSPYKIEIYGLNFATETEFNTVISKIYTKFLRAKNISEVKVVGATTKVDQDVFTSTIACSGVINLRLFEKLTKILPGIQINLSMPKKRTTKAKVTFSEDLIKLYTNQTIPLKPKKLTHYLKSIYKKNKPMHILVLPNNKHNLQEYVNDYLLANNLHKLIPIKNVNSKKLATTTHQNVKNNQFNSKLPTKDASKLCFYSPNASIDDLNKAIEYATAPFEATLNYKLDNQSIKNSLRKGLIFNGKIINAPKIPNANITVNRAQYQKTSLTPKKKESLS